MGRIVDQEGREYLSNTAETSIGKVEFKIDVTDVPKDLIKKVSVCLSEALPFGLSCDESVIVWMPHEMTAVWYARHTYQKTVYELPNMAAFVAMLTQYFHTHPYFRGPVMTLNFVNAVKIILYERERKLSEQLPDPSLPESTEPAGPVETGGK